MNLGRNSIKFLEEHCLEPHPANYRFAYLYLEGESEYVTREINYHVENGLRLHQDLIDQVMQKHEELNPDKSESLKEQEETLKTFVDQLMTISRRTQKETRGVEKDLSKEIQNITEGAEGENLRMSVARILTRARQAERQLANASTQINRLQRDLEEAKNKASIDELTGIPNRRSANAFMADLAEASTIFSVGIIDIDHFKKINDQWGHGVGDRVLRLVAHHLQENLEPAMVARWGGEEFLVITEDSPEITAEKIESAKNTLATRDLRIRETKEHLPPITFSAGVADTLNRSSDEAIEHADEMLYKAKRS